MVILNDSIFVDISLQSSYTQSGLNNKLIAQINPFRYRSYYYDTETGLYYLNSRYYDPETGRFINADDLNILSKTLDEFNGLNLYSYCFNNPVNTFDEDGQLAWWKKLLIGLAIIVGVAIISTAIAFTGGGAAAFFGTLGSAIMTGLKTAVVTGLTSALISGSVSVISGISQGKSFGNIMQDFGNSLLNGFSDGFLSGSIFAGASMLGSSIGFRISGAYKNGNGWKYGKISGGYQTPSTKGVTLLARNGGINGGRTFSLDLDLLNGLHFHTNKLKFLGLNIKSHISLPFALLVGIITSIIKK